MITMQLPDTRKYHNIAIISIAGQMLALAFAFLFHFAIARLLGVSLYGDLGVLIGVYTVLMVPIASIQAILMREVAVLQKENKEAEAIWIIKKYFKRSVLFGVPAIVITATGLWLTGFVVEPITTLLILLSIPLFYGVLIMNSYFQGKLMPWHYSGIVVLVDALRISLAVLLVLAGYELLGVAVAYLVDALLLFTGGFFFLKTKPAKQFDFTMKTDLSYILPTNIIFSLFMVTDLFFVRYMLGASDAGLYNAASMLARAIFYANVGLMAAFLPQSSTLDLKRDMQKIKGILSISILILLGITAGIAVFRDLFLGVLYGSGYLVASPLLGMLAISFCLLAGSVLLVNLLWSQREQKLPLIASAGAYVLFLVLLYLLVPAQGANGAVQASVLSTACLFLLNGIIVLRRIRK
jgi:O-antigen/teichoic acid export membrane protein